MWQRTLSIYVDVPDSWLDGDGEDSDNARDAGWQEIRDEVQKAVGRIWRDRKSTIPSFDTNWEDVPEYEGE